MAEFLKRQYGLVALKTWLDTYSSENGPRVRLALEAKIDGVLQTLGEWTLTTDEIGLPSELVDHEAWGRGPDFRLPYSMTDELKSLLTEIFKGDQRPIWLHLAKPYGYLGLVPWERLLSQRLKVPILRLPDFIVPPPFESRSSLDVVLCSSAFSKDFLDVPHYLSSMARLIIDAVPRRVRLHAFVDVDVAEDLRTRLKTLNLGDEIMRVYPPEKAKLYSVSHSGFPLIDAKGPTENPWLLWIQDSLRDRSVDVVHFLCHGYFTNERGAIATSASPVGEQDPWNARFIGPSELTTFLTQVGAWAVGVSSPPNNFSEIGLRALADNIGQMRPGSVLHHDLETDSSSSAMAESYRFLFSPEPERPPVSPSVFMYCQPHRVALPAEQQEQIEQQKLLEEMLPPESLSESSAIRAFGVSLEQDEEVPTWVAASQRFIEQATMQLSRNVRSSQTPGQRTSRSLEVELDNLRQLQEIVARVARETKSGGEK
jgi:hypothetical protein